MALRNWLLWTGG